MAELQGMRLDGEEITLRETSLAELKEALWGELILPQDADYDQARLPWNINIDRHPALIVRCAGAADVITCVDFARANDLLLSVRGGGHNIRGTSVCDGGMVLDLSRMNSIRVDPVRRAARAEGGTKWGRYDRETQAFGLASTGGTNHDTGIGGLTLGGGMGWLGGKYGLALDNLLAVDIVTADGQLRQASASENPDLFWAVRGGGGNFGVVTSFEYQVHPVGPLLTALALYPLQQTRDVLRLYDEFAGSIPDEVNTAAALATLPGGGPPVAAIAAVYNGDLQKGEEVLRPLRQFGRPFDVRIEHMPYVQVQHWLDPFVPDKHHYYETGHFMRGIADEAAETLLDRYARTSSPGNLLLFQQLGNAANRVPVEATAFGHRDARYALNIISCWADTAQSERHFAWSREVRAATAAYATGGVYVNDIGREGDGGGERVRSAYGPNYLRLAELKRKYDPGNLFRHNQNIAPAPWNGSGDEEVRRVASV